MHRSWTSFPDHANGSLVDIVDVGDDGKNLTWREKRFTSSGHCSGSTGLRLILENRFDQLYPASIRSMTRKYSRFNLRQYWWDDLLFRYADTAIGVLYCARHAILLDAMFHGLFARSWINPFSVVVLAGVFLLLFEGIRRWILHSWALGRL